MIDSAIAPLEAQVRLVPDDEVLYASFEMLHKSMDEVAVVLVVLLIEVAEGGVLGPRPLGHEIQSRHHSEALVDGVVHDHVCVLPVELALGRFDIAPGEVLNYPRGSHLPPKLKRALYLQL